MELFWTIALFLVPLSVAMNLYHTYKNRGKVKEYKEPTWLEKKPFYRYVKLVFFTRVRYREWTVIFQFSFWISVFLLVTWFIDLIARPAIPLNQLQFSEGIVESIQLNKKTSDKLILKSSDRKTHVFSTQLREDLKNRLLGQRIQVWYHTSFNVFAPYEDWIYQLYLHDKPLNERWKYNYEKDLREQKEAIIFMIKLIVVALGSIVMLWTFNRKELPIHRLTRMKLRKLEERRKIKWQW
ncbi:MAG: hypothetical protein PHO27_12365 [Sulfuricurvum sp.]|nr:hypothetical protein [Sulfuricurvum sp.]